MLAIVFGVFVVSGINSSKPAHVVVAYFTDASPLLVGNDVRIDGVKVGTIGGMKVVHGDAAVSLDLSAAAYPLHTDATATVRPASLLGERYVNLNRGSATAPILKPGAVLSTSQTGQDTTLDDVLNTLNDPTGDGLAALVTVLGEGSDGNGANLAAALKALAPAMTDTTALAKILDQQNQLLTSTLDNVGPVASALASDNGKTLTNLTKTANSLLGVTAANEIALKQTLEQLPATLSVARATLSDLAGTANAAAPTLESIRPVTDNLSQITAELQQFSDSLSPALASAAPVLEKAKSLLTEAAPVVSALQTAGPAVVSDAKSLQPIVGDLAGNITNVLNFIKYWALTTNGYDGISHYFRAMLVVTPLSATGLLPGGGNLGVGGTSSPTIATPTGKPSTTSPTPPATTGLRDLLNGVLGGLLSSTTSTDGGVTGMTKTQEQGGLLDLLGLGGN